MAFETPLWMEAASTSDPTILYSARQIRSLISTLWRGEGVITQATDLIVTQRAAGANYSVDVTAGSCVITGDSVAFQGDYLCRSTSSVNLTIANPPSSGIRTDIVVARAYDKQSDGGTLYQWDVEVITGAGTSGVVPTVPGTTLLLATITVPANLTSVLTANITDNRNQATLLNDTGWQSSSTTIAVGTTATGATTGSSRSTVTSAYARRIDDVCSFYVGFTLGAPIASEPTGNVVNTCVFQLQAPFLPSGATQVVTSGVDGASLSGYVLGGSGLVYISAAPANYNISTGTPLSLGGTIFL